MIVDSTLVLKEARTWLGTPWQHNQACKGCGVDCLRFITSVYSHLGCEVGNYPNYGIKPKSTELLDFIDSVPSTELSHGGIEPGQLLVFNVTKIPYHVGIATDKGFFIHACDSMGKVVERRLGRWETRIVAKYNVHLTGYEQ